MQTIVVSVFSLASSQTYFQTTQRNLVNSLLFALFFRLHIFTFSDPRETCPSIYFPGARREYSSVSVPYVSHNSFPSAYLQRLNARNTTLRTTFKKKRRKKRIKKICWNLLVKCVSRFLFSSFLSDIFSLIHSFFILIIPNNIHISFLLLVSSLV